MSEKKNVVNVDHDYHVHQVHYVQLVHHYHLVSMTKWGQTSCVKGDKQNVTHRILLDIYRWKTNYWHFC